MIIVLSVEHIIEWIEIHVVYSGVIYHNMGIDEICIRNGYIALS